MTRLLRWVSDNIALAAISLGLALFLLDALVRGIAWSVWGVLLPTIGGHGVIR